MALWIEMSCSLLQNNRKQTLPRRSRRETRRVSVSSVVGGSSICSKCPSICHIKPSSHSYTPGAYLGAVPSVPSFCKLRVYAVLNSRAKPRPHRQGRRLFGNLKHNPDLAPLGSHDEGWTRCSFHVHSNHDFVE